MAKMTELELKEWGELYTYVKDEILKYDESTKVPNYLVLRLKGLNRGQFIANNSSKLNGNYSFKEIEITFKYCKLDIIKGFRSVEFRDERHKVNYMMSVVESNLNTVRDKLKQKIATDKKVDNVSISEGTKLVYKSKSKTVKNNKLKDLI